MAVEHMEGRNSAYWNPRPKAQTDLIHAKAKQLMAEERYEARQAHAIAASMLDKGRLGKDLTYYSVEEFPKGKPKGEAKKPKKSAKPSKARTGPFALARRVRCSQCNKSFKTPSGLKWHRSNAH